MGVFLFIAGLVILFCLVGVIFILVNNLSEKVSKLSNPERQELMLLRRLSDELLFKSYERVESDAFAVVVLEDIRAHQRRVSSTCELSP
jgi:hypothetical protein